MAAKNTTIGLLKESQLPALKQMLEANGLPAADVAEHWKTFIGAEQDGTLVGAIGLEIYATRAFIRSFVVKKELRNHGLGKQLYDAAVAFARTKRVVDLGLLTNTAEKFFTREGFRKVEKDQTPAFITQTKEYTTFCPSSALVMVKELE